MIALCSGAFAAVFVIRKRAIYDGTRCFRIAAIKASKSSRVRILCWGRALSACRIDCANGGSRFGAANAIRLRRQISSRTAQNILSHIRPNGTIKIIYIARHFHLDPSSSDSGRSEPRRSAVLAAALAGDAINAMCKETFNVIKILMQ